MNTREITIPLLFEKKKRKEKIVSLTAYESHTASVLDKAGVDIILVGDSLGMVFQGRENTLPVTLDEMKYHSAIVSEAVEHALVIADMPFMSVTGNVDDDLEAAGMLMKECGVDGVKIEGGEMILDSLYALVEMGIPVMGHVGLRPQRVKMYGGFRRQGRTSADAKQILQEAKLLEEAGVFSIVVENVPEDLGKKLAKELQVPVIGIGAGHYTDGQILVSNDIFGMTSSPPPFVKVYANVGEQMEKAVNSFIADVKTHHFPLSDSGLDKNGGKKSRKHLKPLK